MDDSGMDEIRERIDRLEQDLRRLQRRSRDDGRPRPPFPRPPSLREVIGYLDQYAIPTAITFLELNIKTLELVRGTLRLLAGENGEKDRPTGARATDVDVRGRALERFDRLVTDLQAGIESGRLPSDDDARRILEDARRLRNDIAVRLEDLEGNDDGRTAATGTVDSEGTEPGDSPTDIDVEGELDTIKAELAETKDGDRDERSDEEDDGTSTNGT